MSILTGSHVVSLAATKIGQKYKHVIAPKDDPTYNGPWDCAELASWVYAQIVGKIFDGRYYGCNTHDDAYSGFWEDDAHRFGEIVSLESAYMTPGAVLIRRKRKTMGHVAISDGMGGTIEAASARLGVVHGKALNRHWDLACKVPTVLYVEGKLDA